MENIPHDMESEIKPLEMTEKEFEMMLSYEKGSEELYKKFEIPVRDGLYPIIVEGNKIMVGLDAGGFDAVCADETVEKQGSDAMKKWYFER